MVELSMAMVDHWLINRWLQWEYDNQSMVSRMINIGGLLSYPRAAWCGRWSYRTGVYGCWLSANIHFRAKDVVPCKVKKEKTSIPFPDHPNMVGFWSSISTWSWYFCLLPGIIIDDYVYIYYHVMLYITINWWYVAIRSWFTIQTVWMSWSKPIHRLANWLNSWFQEMGKPVKEALASCSVQDAKRVGVATGRAATRFCWFTRWYHSCCGHMLMFLCVYIYIKIFVLGWFYIPAMWWLTRWWSFDIDARGKGWHLIFGCSWSFRVQCFACLMPDRMCEVERAWILACIASIWGRLLDFKLCHVRVQRPVWKDKGW